MKEEIIDIGNAVYCDSCNGDYTESDEEGGLLFGSSAYCPKCAPRIEQSAILYNEVWYIRGRCPVGMSFREWVLHLRGGNNTIKITTWDQKS